MAQRTAFRILIASDGSLAATAALVTATSGPWPEPTQAFGIVAEPPPIDGRFKLRTAATRAAEEVRVGVARALERRWPDARIGRRFGEPVTTIVREARRTQADLIVMGWRGHGVIRRSIVGSVSRGVVRQANCSVLVVRHASRNLRRLVLGYDGSPNADRAIDFVARLKPDDGRITLVMAVQMMQSPAQSLISSAAKGTIGEEIARVNVGRARAARRMLENAAKPLLRTRWKVDFIVTEKAVLEALRAACVSKQADLLVLGATGTTGLRGLLLGSVAQSALDRSSRPVLIVR